MCVFCNELLSFNERSSGMRERCVIFVVVSAVSNNNGFFPHSVTQYFAVVHYNDVIMSAMAYQINSLMVVYSTVYSDADQREHQISATLAFVRGINRWPENSPHKGPVTRKLFPFVVIMICGDVKLRRLCVEPSWHRRWRHKVKK